MLVRSHGACLLLPTLALIAGTLSITGCLFDWDEGEGTGGNGTSLVTTTDTSSSSTGGAGGAAPLSPFYRDGTRLEATYTDFGGGATAFTGWFDTELGIRCSFQPFATGDVACVPAANDAST